ncbi:MAG: hypothetical protein QOJ59_1271, partial [Thermomicrobiales bacterium]|nr:hypothetical protein [Thermomicrobiales bacterium]
HDLPDAGDLAGDPLSVRDATHPQTAVLPVGVLAMADAPP